MVSNALNHIIKYTHKLIEAPTCCKELKAEAEAWLKSLDTEEQPEQTRKFIDALEECIVPIRDLIRLAQSEPGIVYFGEEEAEKIAQHAMKIEFEGAKYCDCPACSAVEEILKKKELLNLMCCPTDIC